MNLKNSEKVVRTATIGIVIYLLVFGITMAFFPVRPFWNDEWRLIYNIKFKTVHELWGRLDLLQQCPRVYLTVLKEITAFFDYSYTSLRLPALVVTAASIPFCFYLKKKIFPTSQVYSYLFILILISSQTFTDYIVQTKQYEMEIFLCLLALWQLLTLLEICELGVGNKGRYILLCFSFLAAPFFSYTYPIAVAPIFPVVLLSTFISLKEERVKANKARFLLSVYLPLTLVCVSIVVFYLIDVRQVMSDNLMYQSYRRMLGNDKVGTNFIADFWNLFALVGSGEMFEAVFGVVGIAAFVYALYRLAKIKGLAYTKELYFILYSVTLLLFVLLLFASGKLLGGVARLTAFTVPAISILIVCFFEELKAKIGFVKVANIVSGILFLALYGNIFTTFIDRFSYPEYRNRIKTYVNTAKALQQARLEKLPILFTDGLRGDPIDSAGATPGKIVANTITPEQIAGVDLLCAEVVLKDNHEYKVWDPIPTFWMPDNKWVDEYVKQLPPQYKAAIMCDGINFRRVER